jgi:hypothetical protein
VHAPQRLAIATAGFMPDTRPLTLLVEAEYQKGKFAVNVDKKVAPVPCSLSLKPPWEADARTCAAAGRQKVSIGIIPGVLQHPIIRDCAGVAR